MPSHVLAVRTRTVSRSGSYAEGFMSTRQSVSLGATHIGYVETVTHIHERPIRYVHSAMTPDGALVGRFVGPGGWREARALLRDLAIETVA